MKNKLILGVACAGLLLTGLAQAAGDVEKGKAKAASCASCHGADGKSKNPTYPNLAGQQQMYLINALKAYKSGDRKAPMMATWVQTLSDEDMANLAAYFSSLK